MPYKQKGENSMEIMTGFPDTDNIFPNCDKGDILTMAFVNIQPSPDVYELEKGYERGTIFPDLDKPFKAGGMKI